MPESLSQKTLKNSLWQVFNLGWVTVLNFFVTPILLQNIGIENYGVYILVLTIISFLSLLDLGTGAGFASSFIEYTVNNELEKRNRLVNSFFVFRLAVGLAGFLLLFSFSFLADSIFGIRGEFLRQTQFGFWFAGMYFAILMASSPFSGVAISVQRFDILGKVFLIQNTLLNLLLIGFALFRPSLTWLLASHFIAAGVGFVSCFIMVKKALPEIKFKLEFYSSELFRKMKFGLYNFVSGIANNSLMQIDRFFVSRMLGNVYLGFYTIPNSLAQKIHAVSASSAATFFPVATDLFYQDEKEKFSQSFRRAMRIGIAFSVLSGTILLIFGHKLLYFWVGQEIADKGAVLLYFFVPTYVLMSIYEILSSFYFGTGKSKVLAGFSCFMALLNIILLVFMVPILGLVGAALAFLLSLVPVIFLIFAFEIKELEIRDGVRFYFILLVKIFVVALLFALLTKLYLLGFAVGLWQTLLLILISFVAIMSLYAVLGFAEKEDLELVKSFIYKKP